MGEVKSAEQVRAEHLRVLGPTLGAVYDALYDEVTWLHAKWKQYRLLYADSPERVDLLNNVAGFFFRVIQDALWEDVVLHVARLTEPCQPRQKENLTIVRLPGVIDDLELRRQVRGLVKAACRQSSFAKEWRNRRLAHKDMRLAVDATAEPLPGISRENMERALAAIRGVLNRIEAHYSDSEVAFEHFRAREDAETLVYYLEAAVKAEARRRERLRQGRPLPEGVEE